MEKLEHIGIAVKDLDKANDLFSRLLGRVHYKTEEVRSEGVITSFFEVSGVKIELLAATTPESPISRHIDKRGEGLHHLAFEVTNLEESIRRYEKEGFTPINPEPSDGADNKRICFLHPRTTNGVLIELCEEKT